MKIPYGKQSINNKDIEEVISVLKGDFLTTGPKVDEFERLFAEYVGSKYAVAVSNGTAALHLSCLALGLKEGEELITSPMTFVASANCALYCQGKVIFADITPQGLIDPKEIEKKITNKTSVIIPVHYSGLSCDLEKIKEIADKHKIKVVEDACHALGSKYKSSKIGDCKYSDMTVFSFHPVKHITTGEGGMITTNSIELYEKLKELRSHGITRDNKKMNKNDGGWYYEMQELGFNYRLTDFQSALGISQLGKVDKFIERRREIAKKYDTSFIGNKNIETLKENNWQFNSFHLYVIKLKDKEIRRKLYDYLKDKGILCQVHYIPVHLQPFYQKMGYKSGDYPLAERFYEQILSIPIYPELTEKEQEYVIETINQFFARLYSY